MSTKAEQADIIIQQKQRERVLGYETTKEFISDAGCDDAPITRTGANHCDATVNKSTLSVQYTCTELEQLRQTHKQELEEKEKVYKVGGFVQCMELDLLIARYIVS